MRSCALHDATKRDNCIDFFQQTFAGRRYLPSPRDRYNRDVFQPGCLERIQGARKQFFSNELIPAADNDPDPDICRNSVRLDFPHPIQYALRFIRAT